MTGWHIAIAPSIAAALVLAAALGAASHWWPAHPSGPSVADITARLEADKPARQHDRVAPPQMWPAGSSHEAPDQPLNVDEAHTVMQQHRRCGLEQCGCKRTALRVLVEAGGVIPAPAADRYLHDEQ